MMGARWTDSSPVRAAWLVLALAGAACVRGELLPSQPTEAPTASPTIAPPTAALEPSRTPTPTQTITPTATPTATQTPEPTTTEVPRAALSLDGGAAAQAYVVPLTVQHLTPRSALLLFRLDEPASGYVIYRQLPASSNVWMLHALDESVVSHQMVLDGLDPDTRYEIQVALGKELTGLRAPRLQDQRWGPLTLRTPPLGDAPLRIGVIGDSGFGEEITDALIARMAQLNLDLVLHTGDLMYRPSEGDDPPRSYALKFFLPFQPLLSRMPVYPVLGNHDVDPPTRWSGEPFYFTAFPGFIDPALGAALASPGRGWYAFSYGRTQLLMLNSQVFHGLTGRDEQTEWLRMRLADPAMTRSIAVMHVPPFSSGRYGNDGRASRSDWVPLFEQSQTPLVLSGHDHNYQRLLFNGVTYVISGGGSSVTYGLEDRLSATQAFVRQSHFVLLEIESDLIRITAMDEEGQVLDRAVVDSAG